MNLKKLSKALFQKGAYSEKMPVRIIHFTDGNEIWSGTARELAEWAEDKNWIAVEVHIDYSDASTPIFYNKGKIITVV